MTKLTFITASGAETIIDAVDGQSVMENAIRHNLEGILAECGGACACATCHVYVSKEFWETVGPPNEMEEAMLEFNEHRKPHSRLSCQIEVSPALEGLKLATPKTQY